MTDREIIEAIKDLCKSESFKCACGCGRHGVSVECLKELIQIWTTQNRKHTRDKRA